VLEDLTFGYKKANIMDIKMGTSAYPPEDAEYDKAKMLRARHKHSLSVSGTLGIRLIGARIYQTSGTWKAYERGWALVLKEDELQEAFKSFFDDGTGRIRRDVCSCLVRRMSEILHWCKTAPAFRTYSSSLFFVYDAGLDEVKADVRIIDFAHVWEITDGGTDTGFIVGVESLVRMFSKIADEAPSDNDSKGAEKS